MNLFTFIKKKEILFLIIPIVLIFGKSIFFDFSPLDDQWMIVENEKTFSEWSNLFNFFTKPLAGLYYRPLLSFSFFIDYQIGKINPFIFHVSNVIYHVIATLLLFRLLCYLKIETKTAFLFSILFSIHPLTTHAVSWIPGRNDSLLTIFSLLSIIHLIKYENEHRIKYIISSLLFFICALFTKETAIVLPFIFIIIIYNISSPLKSNKKNIVLFSFWFTITAFWYLIRSLVVNSHLNFKGNLIVDVIHFLSSLFVFFGKCIIPINLSVFPTSQNFSFIPATISIILIFLIIFTVQLKNKKLAYSGLIIFFILIVIPSWYGATSNLNEHYEHRAYFPLIGIILFLSNINQSYKYYNIIIINIIIVFGITSFIGLDKYKTKYSFIDAGIKEAPEYYYFYTAKADNLLKEEKYQASIQYYDVSIKMQPKRAQLYSARGFAYIAIGNTKKAIEDFSIAIEISQHPDMYLNRCLAYNQLKDYIAAWKDLMCLKQKSPHTIPAGLENELSENIYNTALNEINNKISLNPDDAVLYIQKAKILISKNKLQDALLNVKTAQKIDTKNKMFILYEKQILSRLPLQTK
jgi:tetratricopeptide (TPR) repeat protein